MAIRPITRGFLIGGIMLLAFYFFILAGLFLLDDEGVSVTGASLGVIEVKGAISESRLIVEKLIDFRENSKIKAIIMRIDSPGGSVGPTQEIFTEVRRTINIKPVVASLGGTCASGGYYIAAACSKIIANPGTLTGSIGVIMEFFNVEGLFEWVGLRSQTIKSGEFKDMGHYTKRLSLKETRLLQDVVDDVHRQFVEAITIGRNLTKEEVNAFADGRLFTGAQAMELKLVDGLGNFQDAVQAATDMAGLKSAPEVYWPKKRKMSYFDLFLDELGSRFFEGVLGRISEEKTNLRY